jgi:hypothetical protein
MAAYLGLRRRAEAEANDPKARRVREGLEADRRVQADETELWAQAGVRSG